LKWRKFENMREAIREGFGDGESFVYAITNSERKALYIGMASNGFQTRYRGGTHNAIDAALDSSGGYILLAEVDKRRLRTVERELIRKWQPKWNVQDKKAP
jgi:predicted GIY-YIG superfamily endonuclease